MTWIMRAFGLVRALPGWLWWLLVGFVGLALVAAQVAAIERRAYRRGVADCTAAHAEAARVQAETWRAEVARAERAALEAQKQVQKTGERIRDRIRTIYRDRPHQCGIGADGMRALADARARLAAAAAGDGPESVLVAGDRAKAGH